MRSTMIEIIRHTERLVGQTPDDLQWSLDDIESVLDRHRLHLEWILLDHDPDYNHYYTRAHSARPTLAKTLHEEVAVTDFARYTQVGFFETDYELREDLTNTSAQWTPDDANLFDGTFTFSTPPNRELFIFAKAYNVYNASADLLMETPDMPRYGLLSSRRLNVTEAYDLDAKIKRYQRAGRNLNRYKTTRLYRG